MAFLADLSRALFADSSNRALPDVISFAFWARRANLDALRRRFAGHYPVQIGLGLVFHICPANVPVNFAFSMAFGLLSGNINVIRLPFENTPTVDAIKKSLSTVLTAPAYADIADALMLVRYERNDDVNRFWSAQADGRVLWGGDETVQYMRSLPTPPRARDISFADRYSFCAIEPGSILNMDQGDLEEFCDRLYNDIYIMNQAACSSPQLIAWIGEEDTISAAKNRLWPRLTETVRKKFEVRPINMVNKFVDICDHLVRCDEVKQVHRHDNLLYRIELATPQAGFDEYRGYNGTLHEISLPSLSDLGKFVTEKYQTMTCQGFDKETLWRFVETNRLRGIDRLVPVGSALDMTLLWDGYDVIASLSRIIDVRS